MKRAFVIGIGAGNPDHVTVQAIDALNQVDVFFVADKGTEKGDLNRLRREICDRFIKRKPYRMVEFKPPVRETSAAPYRSGIEACNDALEDTFETLFLEEVGEGQCAGFLVWGDPSLYDSTLRILTRLQSKGSFELEYEVIPGISSVQALAARHKVPLNRIGEAIEITTGRKLMEGFPNNVGSVVVMLDNNLAFRHVPDRDIEIYWGAYLGTDDEILVSGKLREVIDDIERLRSAARDRKGWIMDTYLRRKGD